ncbi:MAG: thrombospondin type 3 repeat-containing protein, partial [Myxococcota bacterium]|nr:thrombospondin type 3 repeat-containing protein [Myxococcota bacterium]
MAVLLLTTAACESAPAEGDGTTEEPGTNLPDDPGDDPGDDPTVNPGEVPPDERVIDPTKDLWEPCADDRECFSDLCLPGPDGKTMCSDFCTEDECPEGWLCMPLGFANAKEGGNYACKAGVVNHCAPCASDQACGGVLDRCREVGEDGNTYCIAHCKSDADCPDNYSCFGDDPTGMQCLPLTGSCVCDEENNGTKRGCEITNEYGTCSGEELCDGPNGWVGCSAITPSEEICDGKDNNCDGAIDEGTIDTDGDGEPDCTDVDDDNDGIEDQDDAFPGDKDETTDTDGDGIGDEEDNDDDGDGIDDAEDAFPKDDKEQQDTDGDGIGDEEDTDADNDGTDDVDDAFPTDPNEKDDTDGDGVGDAADTDDDGDGVEDEDDAFPT